MKLILFDPDDQFVLFIGPTDSEGDQSIYGELQTEYISGCQDCLISLLCTI